LNTEKTMTTHRFGPFSFDTSRDELRKNGELVGLRPKTKILLGVLLAHPEQPLKHQELLDRVWPTTRAGTNNLFQAISELRSAFNPLNPIRTLPNLGYAWCEPLQRDRRWIPAAAAACLILALAASMTLIAPAQESSTSNLPPAYRAFFAGLDDLDNSQPDQAAAHFELAITENPDFSEAYLLLAQSLIRTHKLDQARRVLGRLLHADHAGKDPYAEMAAMDLMGQINQRAGAIGPTLEWTKRAFENAQRSGYICAVADLESRMTDVERLLGGGEGPIAESDWVVEAAPLPELCGHMPARLKSSAIDACRWNVDATVGLNFIESGSFKIFYVA